MESEYLDRLARSARFDTWRTEELTEALAMLDQVAAGRAEATGRPRVINIRLQVYRQRLLRELNERSAQHKS
jgi:hypothetical protein